MGEDDALQRKGRPDTDAPLGRKMLRATRHVHRGPEPVVAEMSGWYYKRGNGEVVGLYSDDEIVHCAARGGISLDTLVSHEEKTKGQWVTARRIAGLRTRIENHRESSNAPPPAPTVKGYDPTRRSWKSRFADAKTATQVAVAQLVRLARAGTALLGRKGASYVCTTCEKEFASSESDAVCPVCGQMAQVACGSCGFSAANHRFSQADSHCPRCGTKVILPGAQLVVWRIAGLAGVSFLIVATLVVLSVGGILASPPAKVVPNGIEIVAVLPDPDGGDEGHEQVTIVNRSEYPVHLHGWSLRDQSGNTYPLMGKIPKNGRLVVTMSTLSMPLSNSGDEVWLLDPRGIARSHVTYAEDQVQTGVVLHFGEPETTSASQ